MYERIRALREDKDMSQEEIASILHISQRAYSHYETGDRSIPPEILSKIAEIHNTSTDYLLNRTNIKKPYSQNKK